jgi:hypothetical protein
MLANQNWRLLNKNKVDWEDSDGKNVGIDYEDSIS